MRRVGELEDPEKPGADNRRGQHREEKSTEGPRGEETCVTRPCPPTANLVADTTGEVRVLGRENKRDQQEESRREDDRPPDRLLEHLRRDRQVRIEGTLAGRDERQEEPQRQVEEGQQPELRRVVVVTRPDAVRRQQKEAREDRENIEREDRDEDRTVPPTAPGDVERRLDDRASTVLFQSRPDVADHGEPCHRADDEQDHVDGQRCTDIRARRRGDAQPEHRDQQGQTDQCHVAQKHVAHVNAAEEEADREERHGRQDVHQAVARRGEKLAPDDLARLQSRYQQEVKGAVCALVRERRRAEQRKEDEHDRDLDPDERIEDLLTDLRRRDVRVGSLRSDQDDQPAAENAEAREVRYEEAIAPEVDAQLLQQDRPAHVAEQPSSRRKVEGQEPAPRLTTGHRRASAP